MRTKTKRNQSTTDRKQGSSIPKGSSKRKAATISNAPEKPAKRSKPAAENKPLEEVVSKNGSTGTVGETSNFNMTNIKKQGCCWLLSDEILVYTPEDIQSSAKIAAFDIDYTIICTKSGKVFPVNPNDWKIMYPEIPGKLKELVGEGYKVVFITNQKGISTGKLTVKQIVGKIEDIVKSLNVPVQVLVSTGIGHYRKPMTGLWDYLEDNAGVEVNRQASVYVGDAAGRAANWAPGKKKDFSNGDRLFALNLSLPFFTPEEFFLKQAAVGFTMPGFDPKKLSPNDPLTDPPNAVIASSKQEIILMVGFPASGKSFFSETYLVPKGYAHVNRDTLSTWQKCVAACEKSLQAGESVVVDNTNPDKESRKRYIDCAKKFKVPVRCFVFNTNLDHVRHNNTFRELCNIGKKYVHVNDMVLHGYKNKFQAPTLAEGYDEIIKVNFVPKFTDEKLKTLYYMYLVEK